MPVGDERFRKMIPGTETWHLVKCRDLSLCRIRRPPPCPYGRANCTELKKGKNVLVVSHGNTFALVKHLESISDRDIERVNTKQFPVYELDERSD